VLEGLDNQRLDELQIVLSLLLQFCSKGLAQRMLLLLTGAMRRLVLLMLKQLSLPGGAACLMNLTDLLVLLLTSSIPSGTDPMPRTKLILLGRENMGLVSCKADQLLREACARDSAGAVVLLLAEQDLRAFANRTFIVEAVSINPSDIVRCLVHICWTRDDSATYELLELLADKTVEALLATPTMPSSSSSSSLANSSHGCSRSKQGRPAESIQPTGKNSRLTL
jgi:hypothetical protein